MTAAAWLLLCLSPCHPIPPTDEITIELSRFPSRAACEHALEVNCAYRRNLEGQRWGRLWLAEDYADALAQTRRHREAWAHLENAQSRQPKWYREEALDKLFESIGPEAYWAGVLPDPVPLAWLTSLDR